MWVEMWMTETLAYCRCYKKNIIEYGGLLKMEVISQVWLKK